MEKPCQHGPLFQKTIKYEKIRENVQLSHHRHPIRKKAPMPLYNTATHDGFAEHRPARGTNIHTAYSTVHVATSVTVAALHKTTVGLCVVCMRMYLCSQ